MKLEKELKSAMRFIFQGEVTEQEYNEAYSFLGKVVVISLIITVLVVFA